MPKLTISRTLLVILLATIGLSASLTAPATLQAQTHSPNAPTWVGLVGAPRADKKPGLYIKRILLDSPAQRAGLQAGDIVLKANGQSVSNVQELRGAMRALTVGQELKLEYLRDDVPKSAALKLVALPSQLELLKSQLMGRPLPAFSYQLVGSDQLTPSKSLEGKVTIVEFWATWCGPCRQTSAYLTEYYPKHKDSVNVIAITAEPMGVVTKFLEKQGEQPTYPIAIDPDQAAHDALLIQSYPTILILDSKQNVRKILSGFNHPSDIGAAVEEVKKL